MRRKSGNDTRHGIDILLRPPGAIKAWEYLNPLCRQYYAATVRPILERDPSTTVGVRCIPVKESLPQNKIRIWFFVTG